MCGINGYIGNKNATEVTLKGLKRIEYRGYDSAGIASQNKNKELVITKVVGGVDQLIAAIDSRKKTAIAIGHTRWATHGKPSKRNAHPHSSRNFSVVHNGIIENQHILREELLKKGHSFLSDTDTEVIVALLEDSYTRKGNILEALSHALSLLEGTFGLAILHHKDNSRLYVARRGSPIVIGKDATGHYVASDALALPLSVTKIHYLDDNQIAVLTQKTVDIRSLRLEKQRTQFTETEATTQAVNKGGAEHFMLKEIREQPVSTRETLRGRIDAEHNTTVLGSIDTAQIDAKKLEYLLAVGCGTAFNAALLASYVLEDIIDLPLLPFSATEWSQRSQVWPAGKTLAFAVSQSGETADTLRAIDKLKQQKIHTHGIVNVVGSSIARQTDSGTYLHCGPEIAVASTKAFTSQVVALILVALKLNSLRSNENSPKLIQQLEQLPQHLELVIKSAEEQIANHAHSLSDAHHVMFLGRNNMYPVALEGALKFKEVTYIPAEGLATGEMKHGPLAMVDEHMHVIMLIPDDKLLKKNLGSLREIEARGGNVLVITDSNAVADEVEQAILLPKTSALAQPFASNIALQFLAYETARVLHLNIDKPRNLAKSVTVE